MVKTMVWAAVGIGALTLAAAAPAAAAPSGGSSAPAVTQVTSKGDSFRWGTGKDGFRLVAGTDGFRLNTPRPR